jgi:hypothetical protein
MIFVNYNIISFFGGLFHLHQKVEFFQMELEITGINEGLLQVNEVLVHKLQFLPTKFPNRIFIKHPLILLVFKLLLYILYILFLKYWFMSFDRLSSQIMEEPLLKKARALGVFGLDLGWWLWDNLFKWNLTLL